MPIEPGKFLSEILAARRAAVEEAKVRVSLAEVRRQAEERKERRDFREALIGEGVKVISELKKASPSKGVLRTDFDPEAIARAYEQAGAAALSVLTEEQYFQGSLDYLKQARAATRLPVLRKDFILDEYQVYEAAAAGADAVLLIVAALEEKILSVLIRLAEELKLAALVEVHSAPELETALAAGATIMGVNNRNLTTFKVTQETSLGLIERIPRDCLAVSESGLKNGGDVARMLKAGFGAVLIGEQFMKAADPGRELAGLIADAQKELTPTSPSAGKRT